MKKFNYTNMQSTWRDKILMWACAAIILIQAPVVVLPIFV